MLKKSEVDTLDWDAEPLDQFKPRYNSLDIEKRLQFPNQLIMLAGQIWALILNKGFIAT